MRLDADADMRRLLMRSKALGTFPAGPVVAPVPHIMAVQPATVKDMVQLYVIATLERGKDR